MQGAFISLVVAAALMGCASATSSSSLDSAPRPRSSSAHDVVGVEEFRRYGQGGTLYEALSRLRPAMLRPRGAFASGIRGSAIDVFINGSYAGGSEVLRQLLPSSVAQVRLVQRSQGYAVHGSMLRGDHALFITLLR